MTDVVPAGQHSPHTLSPIDTLPDVVARPNTLPDAPNTADTAHTAGTLADGASSTDTLLAARSKVPVASDTSPPEESPEAPPACGTGSLTVEERLARLPPPDESHPYEPVEVPIADIVDYLFRGVPSRHDR
jgi:hypothetical protein